jgi:predicted negative regulator of RcsB-dependent stress response
MFSRWLTAAPPAPQRGTGGRLFLQPVTSGFRSMVRHPTARKVHRPPPTADDVFVERVLETSAWARTHQRALIIAGVAVGALLGGTLIYRNHRANVLDNAATELTQVRQTALAGNHALAVRDLERFLDRFGDTPSAAEARLMLGEAYLDSGQPQNAIEAVGDQAADLNEPLGVPAAFLLASAFEAANQLDRAEAEYLRIAERAPLVFQKERAWDAVARLRTERGDNAGAVQAYDRLLEILPTDNQDRVVYEMRRAEVQARATAG